MAVHFIKEDREPERLNRKGVKAWIEKVVEMEGRENGIINFVFCSDNYLLNVNLQYLKRDYLTDVIAFNYSVKKKISGDILISLDRIRENAAENRVTVLEEMKRVMVHGVLHLIGYDDNNPENKAEMRRMEELYLDISPE